MNNFNDLLKSSSKMPILFLGHGSPINAIEENEFVEGFRTISNEISKPKAILCISAHWETKGSYVTAMQNPRTIHDFGGFPPALYQVQYPASGCPILANEIINLIPEIHPDFDWGLDHGTWSVVKHLYPKADVPIVQLSIDYTKTTQKHYELAQKLVELREKEILIIGSGNMVHNLGMLAWDKMNEKEYGYDWAIEASEKMIQFVLSNNHEALINYKNQGRSFQFAIPTPEHFLPLIYVLGLKTQNEEIKIFNNKAVAGSLTMTSLKIG